ncbi:MAG: enoyl-CoA hydratase/isomerase family protein, partial [Flavobacteriales bacterium]
MSFQFLLLENIGATRIITINRPDQMNALNKATIEELHTAFADAEADENVRAIVLTGAGEKAFVAGADIKEFASFSVEQGKELSLLGHEQLFNFVERLNTPVIAAVNGYAFGGGLELAMSCHMRVASSNAVMGLPEVSLGVIPGYGGTQRLPRLVGRGKATELIVTAGRLSAADALQWGLVNHVVELEALMQFTTDLAG